MNCLIDKTIRDNYGKGKRVEVIKRYIKMKYNIVIDVEALKARLKIYQLKHMKFG